PPEPSPAAPPAEPELPAPTAELPDGPPPVGSMAPVQPPTSRAKAIATRRIVASRDISAWSSAPSVPGWIGGKTAGTGGATRARQQELAGKGPSRTGRKQAARWYMGEWCDRRRDAHCWRRWPCSRQARPGR